MTKIIELKNLITKKENSEIEKILTDGLDQSLVEFYAFANYYRRPLSMMPHFGKN